MLDTTTIHPLLNNAGHLPPLYSTDEDPDPIVWVCLYSPDGLWAWYLTEYSQVAPDGTEHLAFGLVVGAEVELGYIHLEELAAIRGPFGLRVIRDVWFEPCPLSVVRAKYVRR